MPDKNVADSLHARAGRDHQLAAERLRGGFDENDRVSMRGTNPSLTQTLINGHAVATGDWFVLDQVRPRRPQRQLLAAALRAGEPGRSCARARTADLVEGGVAGTVDIITRKPLDFRKPLTLEASAGRGLRRAAGRRPTRSSTRSSTGRTTPAPSGVHGAGVLREAPPAPRRPGDPRLRRRSRPRQRARDRAPRPRRRLRTRR